MVICGVLSDLMSLGCPTAGLRAAMGIQCPALPGEKRDAMAHDAARFPAVVCGASTDSALAARGLLRIDGARSSRIASRVHRARGAAQRDGAGQPHAAIDPGVGRARWL